MKKYQNLDNIIEREHKIEVTIQLGEYKGTLISNSIYGNCFGFNILSCVDEDMIYSIDEYEKVNCSVDMLGEDWFRVILFDELGNETEFEDECRNFSKLIVGIRICECNILN